MARLAPLSNGWEKILEYAPKVKPEIRNRDALQRQDCKRKSERPFHITPFDFVRRSTSEQVTDRPLKIMPAEFLGAAATG